MLNRHGKILHPCQSPFLTRNHADRWLAVLTAACCLLYRFRSNWSSCGVKPISSIVIQFVMLHHVKSLREVNVAEAHYLISFSCLLQNDPEVGNLIVYSSSWPKSSLFLSYLAFKLDLHSVQNHSHQYLAGV